MITPDPNRPQVVFTSFQVHEAGRAVVEELESRLRAYGYSEQAVTFGKLVAIWASSATMCKLGVETPEDFYLKETCDKSSD